MTHLRHTIIAVMVLLLCSDGQMLTAQNLLADYQLVFADEFNGPDMSSPDNRYWTSSPRIKSRWGRWIKNSSQVVFLRHGHLVCRAIPNNHLDGDTARMITGSIESINKFSFQYGRIEVRLRTNRHHGNFPAAWLLPQPPAKLHPYGGEIDIFESYGSNPHSYHTAHTHWTVDLGQKKNPQHQFRHRLNVKQWHIYGVEWTPQKIVFLVDNRVVGVYLKASSQYALDNGQWPFDHPFYIILNQSVGDDTWGEKPHYNKTFETEVDWVRVYQKREP